MDSENDTPKLEVAIMKVIDIGIDIARSPRDVFDYVSDASKIPDWQSSVEEAAADEPAVREVGMRGHEQRRTPGGTQTIQWEVTECEPGVRWAIRGIDGPIRAHVTIDLSPADGEGTHVGYRMWFEGHGVGRLIRPMVFRGARNEAPASLALLKQRLETVAA